MSVLGTAVLLRIANDEFNVKAARDVEEACELVEVGLEHVTGECHDGGKIF